MASIGKQGNAKIPPAERSGALQDVVVLIPALNEEASLPLVLRDLPAVRRVIVIDNGSTDATAAVARECGAMVVHEPLRGYGAACLRGLRAIDAMIEQGEPAPRVVAFIDADYSDHPEELPQIVTPILRGEADFVLGSRLLGRRERGAMPPQSVYGNRLACWLMHALFRANCYSDLGPFRALRYDKLCELEMCDRDYGWTIEMQIKALQAELRILEVPASYRRRIGHSKISGTISGTLKAGSKILYLIAKYGWKSQSAAAAPPISRAA